MSKRENSHDWISLEQLYWCLRENKQPVSMEDFAIAKGDIKRGPHDGDEVLVARFVKALRENEITVKGHLGKVLLREKEWDYCETANDEASLDQKTKFAQDKLRHNSTHILDRQFTSQSNYIEVEHLYANSIVWEENMLVLWNHDQNDERLKSLKVSTRLDRYAGVSLMTFACFGDVQVRSYQSLLETKNAEADTGGRPQLFNVDKIKQYIERVIEVGQPQWIKLDGVFADLLKQKALWYSDERTESINAIADRIGRKSATWIALKAFMKANNLNRKRMLKNSQKVR